MENKREWYVCLCIYVYRERESVRVCIYVKGFTIIDRLIAWMMVERDQTLAMGGCG